MVQSFEAEFAAFKSCYPDPEVDGLIDLNNARSIALASNFDWNTAVLSDFQPKRQISVTPCEIAIGQVVLDAICLAIGAAGLRKGFSPRAVEEIAEAAAPAASKIEKIIATLADPHAKSRDIALGIWHIFVIIRDAGLLKAVWAAFKNNLTWYNALLYAVTGLATIVAALATDGLAFAAEIVLVLVSAAWMFEDLAKAVKICGVTTSAPAPSPPLTPALPLYTPNVTISTEKGLWVVVDGGGLGGPDANAVVQTNRKVKHDWEQFTLNIVDHTKRTVNFCLHKDGKKYYVTAMEGGGVNGPKNSQNPVQTNGRLTEPTDPVAWEKMIMVHNDNGTYSILSPNGYYVTFMNGGGVADKPGYALATNREVAGAWETFVLDELPH